MSATNAVLINFLEFYVIGKAAAVASCYADAFGLLSVSDYEVGVGIECYLLDESFVLGFFLCADTSCITLFRG